MIEKFEDKLLVSIHGSLYLYNVQEKIDIEDAISEIACTKL